MAFQLEHFLRIGPYLCYIEKFITQFRTTVVVVVVDRLFKLGEKSSYAIFVFSHIDKNSVHSKRGHSNRNEV